MRTPCNWEKHEIIVSILLYHVSSPRVYYLHRTDQKIYQVTHKKKDYRHLIMVPLAFQLGSVPSFVSEELLYWKILSRMQCNPSVYGTNIVFYRACGWGFHCSVKKVIKYPTVHHYEDLSNQPSAAFIHICHIIEWVYTTTTHNWVYMNLLPMIFTVG